MGDRPPDGTALQRTYLPGLLAVRLVGDRVAAGHAIACVVHFEHRQVGYEVVGHGTVPGSSQQRSRCGMLIRATSTVLDTNDGGARWTRKGYVPRLAAATVWPRRPGG